MATKTPSDGSWILQYSFKVPNGDLVNARGATIDEFRESLAMLKASLEDGTIQSVLALIHPVAPKSNVVTMNRPASTTAPSGAEASGQGPMQVGDGFVVTTGVQQVFDKKDTGRSNAKGPIHSPGTVVGTNGVKYDTFDTDLLAIARQAKESGAMVNVMYKFNEKYKKNTIAENGLSIFGTATEASY